MKVLSEKEAASVQQQGVQTATINAGNIKEFAENNGISGGQQSEYEKAVVAAFREADEEERKEAEKAREEAKAAEEKASNVNLAERSAGDGLLSLASGTGGVSGTAKITKENKDAFCSSLISNSRYTEKFSLFGGKLSFTLRSRTLEETDSIEAYLRWMAASGGVYTAADYSNLARKILLAAQVEELNGVTYPVLSGPMRMTEVDGKREPPGWLPQLDTWGKMADAIALAITRSLVEFEAKYWYMVENANDTNFWLRGESTVE